MLPNKVFTFLCSGTSGSKKVLLGLGGGHYVPRHMDIILKGRVWVGHLLSGYSLAMEDPSESKGEKNSNDIRGTWKHAIKAAYDATVEGFPGGEVIAHLDRKSFKGWQKKAIIEYLNEQNINNGNRVISTDLNICSLAAESLRELVIRSTS